MNEQIIRDGFRYAAERFAAYGIDVESAMSDADMTAVSMHAWQGDDLRGFDNEGDLSGGIAATGDYPGRARTAEELRADLREALKLIPGKKRLNLHACEAEPVNAVSDRDSISVADFQSWIDFCKEEELGLDFNPTFFSHPKMDGNFTLASADNGVRNFWIEHGKRCHEIGNEISKRMSDKCVVNYWMPDGYKDVPADTLGPRERMEASLDEIFSEDFGNPLLLESIESKLFGLGVESYTVASHEFSLLYALTRGKLYCMDMGHFHPTEVVSAKITSVVPKLQGIMLHLSRGVRWDSDHVLAYDYELQAILNEIIHNGLMDKVQIGLDFFDASINRIACWAIGMRNAKKAVLYSFLTPAELLREKEKEGDLTARHAYFEEFKSLPYAAVWDEYCLRSATPVGEEWLAEVKSYENRVLSKR